MIIINFDDIMKENTKLHKPNWSQIHNQSNKILINSGSGSLENVIKYQPDTFT